MHLNRRNALRLGALASAAAPDAWSIRPFGLGDVALDDSIFTAKRDRMLGYAKGYAAELGELAGPDRMLYNFRAAAGLSNPDGIEPPGSWDNETGYLRGHYSGHFLSMLAQAWAGTGDRAYKRKLDHFVAGLGECRDAFAAAAAVATPRVEGRSGTAVRLTGSPIGHAEHLALPAGLVDGLTAVTVATWIKPGSADRSKLPDPYADPAPLANGVKVFDFGADANAHMYLTIRADNANPFPRFAVTTGGATAEQRVTAAAPLAEGEWTHLAVTLGGGTAVLYVNGTAAGSGPVTLAPADLGATAANWIGRGQFPQGLTQYLNADIDEFHVFGTALGAEQVAALAAGEGEGGDLAAYRFDDEPGPLCADASGNGRDAVLIGPSDGNRHAGFIAAYPETQFMRLEEFATYGGNAGIWAPYYTTHKIMAGLLDAHRLSGSTAALELATGLGDWIHSRLSKLPRERLDRMWSIYIAGEYGGMNESLANLAQARPDRPEYLETAKLFDNTALLQATVAGTDLLDGKHANQHLPQFTGYLRMHEQGAGEDYRRAAEQFFDMVVPHRLYAHGGTGVGEIFRKRGVIAGSLWQYPNDPNHAETCCVYNLLKLARNLFFHTGDPKYMEYYERALYNQILGSRHDEDSTEDPEVTYFAPVRPGRWRDFGNTGTCCGGTGMENHTKYQDSVYFAAAGDEALYVNLYMPSTLAWGGVTVVQTTDYPFEGASRLTVRTRRRAAFALKLRVPSWAEEFSVKVNGRIQDLDTAPGTYVTVSRTWRSGDTVDIAMPLRLHTEAALDDPGIESVYYGPTLLAIQHEPVGDDLATGLIDLAVGDDLSAFEPTGEPLHFTAGGYTFAPFHLGNRDPYHLYWRRR
ncbi:glycoside hydrolase family 127 protein [Glycomyces luteolus]|uniref:Glycoside hydrolase family 127 protein n=1 Tax=Glycomyces luteolus TaxID=2670330 RepID=A0A9X3SQB7_9ACTN|nr:beta-L-arabinofuranosidase domain-containing protein [Glycomyces luteolus]MDA1360357.1 glycoside hydrolase family 127 protein [Glycomyces luteolus]